EEAIEAADGGDAPSDRAWGQTVGALLADERFERRAVEGLEGASGAAGVFGQRHEIARVALERVISEPALDAQVVEIRVAPGGWSGHQPSHARAADTVIAGDQCTASAAIALTAVSRLC